MGEVFEDLKTEDAYMTITRSSNTIEAIVDRNFGNKFHHHNGTNQLQNVHNTHMSTVSINTLPKI